MRTYGPGDLPGASLQSVVVNRLILDRATTFTSRIPSVVAQVTGGAAESRARGVVYSGSGALLGQGSEVVIDPAMEDTWVTFPLWDEHPGGVEVVEGENTYFGLHVGVGTLSIYGVADSGGFLATDTYSGGAADPLPSTSATFTPAWYAVRIDEWTPPEREELAWYANLPFIEAQSYLGSGGPNEEADHPPTCSVGWHGRTVDEEEGCFAIAQTGSEMAELVGDKVAVRLHNRVVYVYVHREADVIEELSLSRRAFLALAPLSTFEINGKIEVMA